MRIDEYQSTKEDTVRIDLDVGGSDGFISVYTFKSSEWARGTAWFNRAFSNKIAEGVSLFDSAEVLGEKVATPTKEYQKITAIRMAHLIESWSFDDEPTLDNAAKLLIAHDHIVMAIDERLSHLMAKESEAKKPQSPQPEVK